MHNITVTIRAKSDNGRETEEQIEVYGTDRDHAVAGYLASSTKDAVNRAQRYLDA